MNKQKNTVVSAGTPTTVTSHNPCTGNRLYLYNNIPKAMKEYPNWLVRKGKIPYSPVTGATGNAVECCGTYEQAIKAVEHSKYDGIGFQFSGTPFTGIDLDHCVADRATGEINELATEVIMLCASYWEYSLSRNGIHIIVYGELPKGVHHKRIEMYSQRRYFTVTGDIFAPAPIVNAQEALDTLYQEFSKPMASIGTIDWGGYPPLEKTEIIALVTTMRKYDYSGKFTMLYDAGDTSAYGSGSEADSALLTILAYWTKGNPVQIEQIFSNSPISERISSDGKNHWARNDYRKRSIERAINFCKSEQAKRKKNFFKQLNDDIFGGNE